MADLSTQIGVGPKPVNATGCDRAGLFGPRIAQARVRPRKLAGPKQPDGLDERPGGVAHLLLGEPGPRHTAPTLDVRHVHTLSSVVETAIVYARIRAARAKGGTLH